MDKRERFAELFRAEYPGLVRELGLILSDRALAEDVAAEGFVELWRKWDRVSGLDRPGAWVRHVALRAASRARWRRGRRGLVEASFESSPPGEGGVDVDLVRALAQLPEAQRTAVVMHHLGGWPTADIAVVLGCADVTVRSHLSRGRLRLADLLGGPDAVEVNDGNIGLSANIEGDVRPPVILGVDTDTGDVAWTTALAEGTDLNWGTPPVRDGVTVFLSTLSHPGSAEENVAHLVELADGTVRWTAGLGGDQGFSEASAIIRGPYVHLPAFPDVVTLDRSNGRRLWDQHGWAFVSTDEGIWTVTDDGTLALLDADTGDVLREVDPPVQQQTQLLNLDGGLVGMVTNTHFSAIDTDGEVQVLDSLSVRPVEFARSHRGVVIVATWDEAVTAYEVEAP